MRWEPHEDCEQKTDTVSLDFNCMALATGLRVDSAEQGHKQGGHLRHFAVRMIRV